MSEREPVRSLAETSKTYGPKEMLSDLTNPRLWRAWGEEAGKLVGVYLWWAREWTLHPVRTARIFDHSSENPAKK